MSEKTKIIKLPEEVVSKIAAGEVVVNPASVVKELVENSIDAGASNIEVQIKDGGKSYIKVVDNGSGMSKEDLVLAVQRYTTSKISSLEDIYNITSYGFRGEALASIGEVSRLVITTSDGIESHKLEMVGGKLVKVAETFREKGTTVEVHDLFFSIPARRKFLSSEKIERRMVTEVIERFLLTKPEIRFLFKVDEEIVYNAPASSLPDRFKLIFPEVKSFEVIDNYVNSSVSISGIISSPQFFRKNRSGQLFFVNGRFVLDNLLHLSLERGYGESLVESTHPYAVIFINIPPNEVDVNIHPQKLQVKFSEPRVVYDAIARCVRDTLRKFEGFQLFVEKIDKGALDQFVSTYVEQSESKNILTESGKDSAGKFNQTDEFQKFQTKEKSLSFPQHMIQTGEKYQKTVDFKTANSHPALFPNFASPTSLDKAGAFTIIKNRYILFEDNDGIVIIDFHAAHERVIYEQLKEHEFQPVDLLIPVEFSIGKSLANVLESLETELKELGFSIEMEKSENSAKVVLKSIPSLIKITQAQETLLEVLEEYRLPFNKPQSILHVLASKACKTAVKTGDKLSEEEVRMLIEEIKGKNLLTCPHGRPIMMKITFDQLDSYFERR
ncbi:DNA mismatch repair endonuclease MutL [Fervidobacterium islandicum]|uniref:DNA mismatch repair protein MutL n=1 Tax=Fervidobacterium islandicum TaxID=2423 RepID=A0AAI8GDN5_FERIS|nr:DNA mismatch repair endonuclease MutL [Fervidobacterium islandicum]AMW33454.1 DNA mismatch repair endonuclease MutL [Fervidobacterium islandicum]